MTGVVNFVTPEVTSEVTRKPQEGKCVSSLVNFVTSIQRYRYVGHTRSPRADAQAPYVVLKPGYEVNETTYPTAVLRLSRNLCQVTSVTNGALVNLEVIGA